MAQPVPPSANGISGRRDGDWLLCYNRRLRNLSAISLRNLSLVSGVVARQRRQTFDDDAVPQNLQSPAKLVALREHKTFSHSRSSTDLRAVAEVAVDDSEIADHVHGPNGSPTTGKSKVKPQSIAASSPRRPEFKRMRRSTLEWTNATAQARQQKLEDVADEHMADVFVTLHVPGVQEPVYVSETVERTMNPSFRQIDWSTCGPGVTRADQLTLRIWARSEKVEKWKQLLDMKYHFQGLHYLCKNLDALEDPLPQNAVLFHMTDGVYIALTDSLLNFPSAGSIPPTKATVNSPLRVLPTSSFDALLRLAKLDDSIQDALATRAQISKDLENLLHANAEALKERDRVAERTDRLETIEYAKRTVERQLEKAHKQHAEKSASIAARRKLMEVNDEFHASSKEQIAEHRPELPSMRDEDGVKKIAIRNQRRRICEELQSCFPIQPRPGKALAFTIRGLHLPNSEELDSEPFDITSAALGHVAQVLLLISFYHAYPLPYPVNPRGSTSTIFDPVSILKTNTPINSANTEQGLRTYPLFSKGVPRFRFEYAVFLLNQDIRILLEGVFNVRVLDVRQTLPNLKYLLYVATAGEGELPARKAGGVRGLLRTPVRRVGSSDSTSSTMSGLTLQGNGKPTDAVESLKRFGGRW